MADDSDRPSGLFEVLILLLQSKEIILLFTATAAVIGLVVALLLPKSYQATARLLPPQQSQGTAAALTGQLGALAVGLAPGNVSSLLKNPADLYIAMLKSRSIADRMIVRFNLQDIYGKTYSTRYLQDVRDALARNSSFTSGKDGILKVEVEDRDPRRSADMANAYVEELRLLMTRIAVTEAAQRRAFFENQLRSAKDELATAENALKGMQQATGVLKIDDQTKLIVENVARTKGQISAKELQIAAMRLHATDDNPDLKVAREELAGLRSQLSKLESQASSRPVDVFIPTSRMPTVGLEYVRRYRDVKYQESIFELLLKQFELAKLDEAREGVIIQVMDAAEVPEKKYKPRRSAIVVLSALAGFVFSLIFIFARSFVVHRTERDMKSLALLKRHLRFSFTGRPSTSSAGKTFK